MVQARRKSLCSLVTLKQGCDITNIEECCTGSFPNFNYVYYQHYGYYEIDHLLFTYKLVYLDIFMSLLDII